MWSAAVMDEYRIKLERLEVNFDVLVQALTAIADTLRPVTGDGQAIFTPKAQQLLAALQPEAIRECSARLQELLPKTSEPTVVAELRTYTRLTYDEIFALSSKWPQLNAAEREREIRAICLRRAL